ncbi:MAG TPA: hypothetical protein VK022_06225 [Paracoccaceae bacterium]|nr:hypothetical protein [Paracoccaceae bacterium]
MSRAFVLAAIAGLVAAGSLPAPAQQVPCNPAVEFCLPIPPAPELPDRDD